MKYDTQMLRMHFYERKSLKITIHLHCLIALIGIFRYSNDLCGISRIRWLSHQSEQHYSNWHHFTTTD